MLSGQRPKCRFRSSSPDLSSSTVCWSLEMCCTSLEGSHIVPALPACRRQATVRCPWQSRCRSGQRPRILYTKSCCAAPWQCGGVLHGAQGQWFVCRVWSRPHSSHTERRGRAPASTSATRLPSASVANGTGSIHRHGRRCARERVQGGCTPPCSQSAGAGSGGAARRKWSTGSPG